MKIKFNLVVLVVLALLSTIDDQLSTILAQGTAFTYQGQLQDNGALANGPFNLTFTLFNTNISGAAVAEPVTNNGVLVSNGLFTVTIDFGGAVWNGETNWLEIAVETNGSSPFTTLSPRQRVTPTPYAITAENLNGTVGSSGLSGTYGSMVTLNNAGNQFTGGFTGNGTGLTNVNAAALGGLSASNFWQLGGNTATSGNQIVGTLNNQPFDLYADSVRAMRLILRMDASGTYSNAPNVIGGSSVNSVSAGVVGATVAGGGGNLIFEGFPQPNMVTADYGTISGGAGNTVEGTASVIGGGGLNFVGGFNSTLSGGYGNAISNDYSAVVGGVSNSVSGLGSFIGGGGFDGTNIAGNEIVANAATIGGGAANEVVVDYGTIGGGYANLAEGNFATIPGGVFNVAEGDYSFAAGYAAAALHKNSFVWGGQASTVDSDRNYEFKIAAANGVDIEVSGSSGLNPAALDVDSTSTNGVAIHAHQGSSDSTAVFGNSGTGDLIKGFSGPSAGTLAFEVQNDGTVLSKGVVLTSDRGAKENFADLDSGAVLAKVAALPVTEWNYRDDSSGIKHIGPVAQDFHAAFGLNGGDDKHISVVDEGGVALAAIQGLNEKVESRNQKAESQIEELKAENSELKEKNDSLEKRLESLEQIVLKQKPN